MPSRGSAPGKISADKLCELTGLTDRQHRNIANQGYFPPPYKSQYEATKTLQGLFRYLRELNQKKGETRKHHEDRLAAAKADTAEDERDRLRRLTILKAEIEPALRSLAVHQRAELQHKFERQLAPNLAGKKPAEVRQLIETAVDDICKIFENGIAQWMEPSDRTAAVSEERGPAAAPAKPSRAPKPKTHNA